MPGRPFSELRLCLRGKYFNIPVKCLSRAPESRLAKIAASMAGDMGDQDSDVMELCMNRSPVIFSMLQQFYLDGHLHLETNYCLSSLDEEFQYWGISTDLLHPCCFDIYQRARDREDMLQSIRQEWIRGYSWANEDTDTSVAKRWKKKLWLIVEEPKSSTLAQIYSMGLTFLIFLSMCMLSVDTLRDFRVASPHVWAWLDNSTSLRTTKLLAYTSPHPAVIAGEILTLLVLTFDFFARVITFPGDYIILAKSVFTYVTVFTILPSWAAVVTNLLRIQNETIADLIGVFYGFRALRVFYFFRLAKQYPLLLIIVKSLVRSISELGLLVILIFMGVSFYGTLLFYVELGTDNIPTLLDAYWWALITMTTVGYGDVTPVSGWGRLIGSLCAISGIVAVALPIPVIVRNFDAYFVCVRSIERMQAMSKKSSLAKVTDRCSKLNGAKA